MTHLVMTMEQGRSSIRAVSTQEYAEMKAVRSATAAPAVAPAAAGVASLGPSAEPFVLNVPTVVESLFTT